MTLLLKIFNKEVRKLKIVPNVANHDNSLEIYQKKIVTKMFWDVSDFGPKMARLIEKISKICSCLIKYHIMFNTIFGSFYYIILVEK